MPDLSETHIVYILTNEAMPGLVKIGATGDAPTARMKQLYSSGVPVPFECFHASRVPKSKEVERRLHRIFEPHRLNANREFFEIDPEQAREALLLVELDEATPRETPVESDGDADAIRKLEKRAERFSFRMIGVERGATLTLDRDAAVTCEVAGASRVVFQGREMSLSAAALAALNGLGFDWKAAQGAAHWRYDGRRLKDIRDELENA